MKRKGYIDIKSEPCVCESKEKHQNESCFWCENGNCPKVTCDNCNMCDTCGQPMEEKVKL